MAESSAGVNSRDEWHHLLTKLKSTAEGILATHSVNVWSTYGSLPRICGNVEAILTHKLRVTQSQHGNALDFWPFVRGLRWQRPVEAPSIEQINKQAASEGCGCGKLWVRQSLAQHSISGQLTVLVSQRDWLLQHYHGEAFLCQPDYFQAMVICLQAVEQNRAALLAEINPSLLQRHLKKRPSAARVVPTRSHHARSASLPINALDNDMRRLRDDPLAPLIIASPKSESVLSTSGEHASPIRFGSSPESLPSAKESLLQVLERSGETIDSSATTKSGLPHLDSDPLMNMQLSQFPSLVQPRKPTRSNSCKSIPSYHGSRKGSDQLSRSSLSNKSRESVVHKNSQSPDLLDRILNEDVEPATEAVDSLSRNSGSLPDVSSLAVSQQVAVPGPSLSDRVDSGVSLNDEASPTNRSHSKKPSHQRSVSDYGLPQSQQREFTNSTRSEKGPQSSEKQSFFDEGGSGSMVAPATECFFPQPAKGQSLVSFLSSQDFRLCAELDRENAHFLISEALIAAIEQMKWNQIIRPASADDEQDGDSDEEIQQLKQRIRIRRGERLREKARGFPNFRDGGLDVEAGAMATSVHNNATFPLSGSPSESFLESENDSDSSEEVDDRAVNDFDQNGASNLSAMKEGGLSLSMASLYEEAEFGTKKGVESAVTDNSSVLSAETVAINLLKRFAEHQLPKASDLVWLVSEQDAPQALLPLPTSYPVSPDDNENADLLRGSTRTRIRGNLEWAPPRAQIIFNIHPSHKRKVLLAKQNSRCAGCGAKVEQGYINRYRYCEYLGKYFCPCCHSNETQVIPARILQKWDFYRYPVSHFSRDLLHKLYRDPLFNVKDINPGLYRKAGKALEAVRECRQQLCHLQRFLDTCRLGQSLREEMEQLLPQHMRTEEHVYSLHELVAVKQGELLPLLRSAVQRGFAHVAQCPLCQAKGFICEICNKSKDVIFPFELGRVTQCSECHSCFHKSCFRPDRCPKCARMEVRRSQLARMLSMDDVLDEDS